MKRKIKNTTLFTFKGVSLSLAGWAYRVRIDKRILRKRLERGWSNKKALTTPVSDEERSALAPRVPKGRPIARLIEFGGKSQSVKMWSKELDIPECTITDRQRKGRPVAQVLGFEPIPSPPVFPHRGGRPPRLLTHDGETLGISEWARRLGLDRGALAYRLAQNWPEEKVFGPRVHAKRGKKKTKRRKTILRQRRRDFLKGLRNGGWFVLKGGFRNAVGSSVPAGGSR